MTKAANDSKELNRLRNEANQFAAKTLRPAALALDRMNDPKEVIASASPLWQALRGAYSLRYHAAEIPRQLGGLGLPGTELEVVLEELGWGSAGLASALLTSTIPFTSVVRAQESELMESFTRPFASDRSASLIGCWAMSEAHHGSDVLAIGAPEFRHPQVPGELIARSESDAYVLSGRKSSWVGNGTIATHALAHVMIESKGLSSRDILLIPLDLPGISRGEMFGKIGQRELNQGEIIFENVRVPRSLSVTKIDGYEQSLMKILGHGNACMSAIFTGLARAAYEEALDYSKRRVQGDKLLCEHQVVQKRIFDMYVEVEAGRALAQAALNAEYDGARAPLGQALAAKIFCSQAALRVAGDAMELFGVRGLAEGALIGKLFRDARTTTAEQGTNEVLALTGARLLLG
jgi:alkylation response protein AidB-like acyl-CoA dehydrogenase